MIKADFEKNQTGLQETRYSQQTRQLVAKRGANDLQCMTLTKGGKDRRIYLKRGVEEKEQGKASFF